MPTDEHRITPHRDDAADVETGTGALRADVLIDSGAPCRAALDQHRDRARSRGERRAVARDVADARCWGAHRHLN
jgi:hypothetical protein